MTTHLQMQAIDPQDPFGRTGRHRTCRIVVQRGADRRSLCWFRLGLDQSIYFGVGGFAAGTAGTARLDEEHRLVPTGEPKSLADLPESSRRDLHLSLHGSGKSHLRAHGGEQLASSDFGQWLPVKKVWNWVYYFSDPLARLEAVSTLRRRDAVVAFPAGDASAEVHIDLIPPDQPWPLENRAIDTVIGLAPPHYGLRVSLYPYRPIEGTVFFL